MLDSLMGRSQNGSNGNGKVGLGSVRRPDAEEALDFAFRLVYAACAHRVVHGEHLESARPLPWRRLTEELALTVRLYLLS